MGSNNITVEEARLVDTRAKEKHSEETGYDYTKQVQNEIQALVEASLVMESDATRPLTPAKPGFYNSVRITTADIEAYKASHPQNHQVGIKRQEYADILSAGGTILKEEQEQSRENIKPHKRFPTKTASTHFVNIDTFSYTAPIEEESHRMGPIQLDDTVTIVDDKVGKDGLFSYVLSSTNDFLYIPRKYLTVLDDVVFAPYNDELALAKGGEPPLWLTFPINEPQYIPQRAEMQVAVFLERQTLPESDVDAALEEAFYLGVPKILKYLGKKSTKEYIDESFVNVSYNDRPAQAVELYLDTRTKSKVKALVKIPRRNIDPLEDENPPWRYTEEYRVEKFSDLLNKLADRVETFKEGVDSYDGTVSVFDAKKESQKLKKMPSIVKTIADINEEYNKNILKDKGTLTIYWDQHYSPLKMTFKSEVGRVYLMASNFSVFPANSCIRSKRTQSLVSNLNYIIEEGELKKPWKEFIEVWVAYPKVQFIPKPEPVVPPEEKEGPKVKTREELLKEDNYYNNVERKIKIAEERTKKSNDVSPSILNNSSLQSVVGKLQEGSDTLYDEFLNSVDFRRISLQALGCALQELPIDTFQKIKNDYDVLKEEYESTKKQFKEGKLLDFLYPDDLPTDDISEAFFSTLGRTLGTMTSSVISSVLGSVLSSLFALCSEENKSKINAPFPEPLQIRGSIQELEDLANELFGEGEVPLEAINGILSDLANLLSPKEFCDLLRGNPSQETLSIVKGLLEASYCFLGLDTDEEIINFFLSLANGIELDICDEIDEIIGYFPEDFLCPPDSSIRDRLLAGKEMTQEQIDEQMKRERDRSRRLAEQLLDDLNKDGINPNLFCSKDEQGNVVAGETSFMDEQFIDALENTIGSLFKNTYDSFNEDGERYIQNLFVEEEELVERLRTDFEFGSNEDQMERIVRTTRKPIPQLRKFYINPEINITDREITIEVPEISSGILNKLPSEVDTSSLLSDSAGLTGAEYNNNSNIDSKIINRNLKKITLLEVDSMAYSDIREQTEVDNTEKIPEENKFSSGFFETEEDECATDEPVPALRLPSTEEIGIDEDIIEFLQNPPPPVNLEKDRTSLAFRININNKSLSSNKKISKKMLDVFNKHMDFDEDTDTTSLLESLIIDGLNEHDDKPSSEDKNLINEKMNMIKEEASRKVLIFLMTLLNRSTYLSQSSTSFQHGDIRTENYIMEYINLGPVPTPECDPHLLMISQLLEKIKENLQDDMCLDLDPSDKNGRPRLTPCIRTTFRHYILESLVSGILSITTFYGRKDNIDGPIAYYILEKMKSSMIEYSSNRNSTDDCNRSATFTGKLPDYYEEFLEQVEEIYGNKSISTLLGLIKSEFTIIREGLYDALLMPDNSLSVVDKMLKKIPEVEEKASGVYSFINFEGDSRQIPDLLPFVFHEGKFCLLLDEFPLKKFAVEFNDGNKKFIVPLVKDDSFIKENILNFCFPIKEYKSMISIHEMETVSKMDSVKIAFGDTRDNLFSLFYAILPEKDDWRKQNRSLANIGGTSNYTKIFDFNNNALRDTPCTDFSFNAGNPDVCWGSPFKGLGFAQALRAARDAALIEFKKYVERNDPAIKLAKRLSFLSKLACVNIPTSAIAASLNYSAPPWFPVTNIAMTYHALGLGIFASSSMLNSDSEEGAKARKEINDSGLKLPPYCGNDIEEMSVVQSSEENQFLPVGANPAVSQVLNFNIASLTPEEISELEQRRAELRVRYLEVSDEHSRLMSIKTEIRNNIDNYTNAGRRNFDNRPAPEELLDEPKFQWNLLDDEIQSLIREQREMDAELTEIARKLNSVQR